MLQMPDGRLEAVTFRANKAEIKIQCRMVEASFERVFQLFGGLAFIVLGLRVDGLTEVKDDLRLLGLLHGKLTGAAHQRLQAAPRLGALAVVGGVFEEDL